MNKLTIRYTKKAKRNKQKREEEEEEVDYLIVTEDVRAVLERGDTKERGGVALHHASHFEAVPSYSFFRLQGEKSGTMALLADDFH